MSFADLHPDMAFDADLEAVVAALKHSKPFSDDEPPRDPPHPGISGRWVHREDLHGQRKSFGVFVCDCGRTWDSAHAFKDNTQDCQGCEAAVYPLWMWLNDQTPPRKLAKPAHVGKQPHDQQRCGECKRIGKPCWE